MAGAVESDCGRSATATVIKRLMKDAFTDKCVPVKLITDGGPQFSSREIKQFCGGWGITHVQSSPHYPQANGAAEAAVKSVKNLIIKRTNRGNASPRMPHTLGKIFTHAQLLDLISKTATAGPGADSVLVDRHVTCAASQVTLVVSKTALYPVKM